MIRIMTVAVCALAALAIDAGAFAPLFAQQQQQPAQRPPAQRPPTQPAQRAPAQPPAPPSVQQPAVPPRPIQQPLPPEGTAVVVVDYNSVIQNSIAGQAARTQLDKRRAQLQQELTQQEADLRKVQDDLEKQRTILAPEAFGQRQRDFQNRVANFQKGVQERGKVMEDATRDAQLRIEKEVNSVIAEIVQEQKYQVVLHRNLVVASQTQLEIGDEVLKRLNKKLSSFQVNFAKN